MHLGSCGVEGLIQLATPAQWGERLRRFSTDCSAGEPAHFGSKSPWITQPGIGISQPAGEGGLAGHGEFVHSGIIPPVTP